MLKAVVWVKKIRADIEWWARNNIRLAQDPPASFFVPDLFYIECTNILWKYVRHFGFA
jgi:hypothetical protein